MNRRSFLSKIPVAASAPFILNGIPVSAMARHSSLQQMAAASDNDRVLVLIQLHGGNDGLNTIIPMDQYSLYYNLRPNIAIPDHGSRKFITLDSTLAGEDQAGLHPDMGGVKELYDQGKAGIVQGVAYENINGSHFRSRDIWFMGGDYDDMLGSGWMGRYLDHLYPGYPDAYPSEDMPDPLGLEIGNNVSLAFHRENGIPMAVSVRDPEQFYDLITSVGGLPPESVADTHYGHELRWIMDIEKKSNQYAGRLKEIFEKGSNSSINYPEKYPFNAPASSVHNPLSGQLKMIARLLSGGVKTKIFLTRIGGFDTHAEQVESYDPTMGKHAALLYHISSAVKAFQDDLKALGLEDRVLTMTFSEFGRRATSNGSWGTDHGTAAPMLVFGKHVNPGIIGINPDLTDLNRNNLKNQFDYRQVFGSVLQDWMGASDEVMAKTMFDDYVNNGKKLPIVGNGLVTATSKESFIDKRFRLESCRPNPARKATVIGYYINRPAFVSLSIFDNNGKIVKEVVNEEQSLGGHEVFVDVSDLRPGNYIYRIKAGGWEAAKRLIVADQ